VPIQRIRWRSFTSGLWFKGPRENNPDGTLRRAKSVFPLRTGSVRSRSGIATLALLDAHSLFKFGGRRIAAVFSDIYREVGGVFTSLGVVLSGNRLTFVSAPPTTTKEDYVFLAGSGSGAGVKLRKLNPALDTATQWALDPPAGTKPSIDRASLSSKDIDTFDDDPATWTGTTVDDDDNDVSATFPPNLTPVTGKKVQGLRSLRFKAAKDKTTRVNKAIAVNLLQFAAPGDSGDEDYIELFIAFNRPKHVKNMEIVFYLGTGAPADFDNENDTYSREFIIKAVKRKAKKKLIGTGDLIRKKDIEEAIRTGRLDKVDFSMAEFVADDKIAVTRRTWTRLTIPKATFAERLAVGSTFTWADVRGVRISVECNKQGGSRVWLDRIRMIGGAGMQGDYQYMFTFLNNDTGTRSNPYPKTTDTNGDEIYDPLIFRGVERDGIELGSSAGVTNLPAPTDSQVTHIEIWRTVGNGTLFFFAAKVASTSAVPATGYIDRVADYPGMFSGGGAAFLQPTELPDDNARPRDTLNDAVGFLGRMWLTRDNHVTDKTARNRVYYSGAGRMETVSSFVPVGSTDEECQKLVVWNDTLFVLTTRYLYRLVNTDEPFLFVPVLAAPGTFFPFTVVAMPSGIIYQARDGIRIFDGNESALVADDALAPIFRGGSSDGISAFVGTASVWGRDEYYVADVNTTLALGPQGWRNVGIPCKAFFWEVDTRILLASPTISGTTRVTSFEGDASGEQGGAVADATVDVGGASLTSDFELETGGVFKGTGLWGILQRIYIEGQTEAQNLAVSAIVDNTVIALGNVSTAVGIKRVMEVAVQRAGFIQGVRLVGTALNKRIEISAVEMDVYIPPEP